MDDRQMRRGRRKQIQVQSPPVVSQDPPVETQGDDWWDDSPQDHSDQGRSDSKERLDAEIRELEAMVEKSRKEQASAMAEISKRQQAIEALQSKASVSRKHWPEGKDLPDSYTKQTLPCPRCRRVLTDTGGQSVVCTSSRNDIAFFRCRCCEHRWKLPVKAR